MSNFFGENITRFRARARNPFTRKADCPMKSWIYLAFAILAEVVGTSCLKASQGFTKPIPSLVVSCRLWTCVLFTVFDT